MELSQPLLLHPLPTGFPAQPERSLLFCSFVLEPGSAPQSPVKLRFSPHPPTTVALLRSHRVSLISMGIRAPDWPSVFRRLYLLHVLMVASYLWPLWKLYEGDRSCVWSTCWVPSMGLGALHRSSPWSWCGMEALGP